MTDKQYQQILTELRIIALWSGKAARLLSVILIMAVAIFCLIYVEGMFPR